jgi:outer membrane protein
MKIRFLCLLIASGMSTGAQGGDLLDAYRMAVANDPSYLSSVFERQITAQDPTIARAALKPSINLTGDGSRIREDVDSRNQATRGSDNYNSAGVALSLNQTLFSRQARIAIDQAELDNQRAGIDLDSARQEVIIRVANSYFSVLGAIDNLDLATSEKIAIQRQLELASERLNVGIGTQTDLYDAEARFQLAEANEIEARNLIEDARESLIAIVGADPGPLRPLREDAPLQVPAPDSAEDWVSIAIANNPALQSASLDFAIAQQEIEFQKSTRSPNIALNAAQGYRDNSGGINGSSDRTNTSVGLELRMPLYLGGAVAARVQKAALGANAQEQVVEFTRRQISRNVRDVYNDVVSGIGRVEALRLAVIAGQSAVEARQEGFSAGLITNLDVLDAQRDLFQARRDYRRARYDFILSVLTLEEVAGQLSEEDVVRINSWLE